MIICATLLACCGLVGTTIKVLIPLCTYPRNNWKFSPFKLIMNHVSNELHDPIGSKNESETMIDGVVLLYMWILDWNIIFWRTYWFELQWSKFKFLYMYHIWWLFVYKETLKKEFLNHIQVSGDSAITFSHACNRVI